MVTVCLAELLTRRKLVNVLVGCGMMMLVITLLIFFFQAEDGIRDTSVTGVQTCALPILLSEQPAFLRCQKAGHSSHCQDKHAPRFKHAGLPTGVLPWSMFLRTETRKN